MMSLCLFIASNKELKPLHYEDDNGVVETSTYYDTKHYTDKAYSLSLDWSVNDALENSQHGQILEEYIREALSLTDEIELGCVWSADSEELIKKKYTEVKACDFNINHLIELEDSELFSKNDNYEVVTYHYFILTK